MANLGAIGKAGALSGSGPDAASPGGARGAIAMYASLEGSSAALDAGVFVPSLPVATDHFAQQIVDALVVKLVGLPTTGANVFAQDDYPRDPAKLPCVNIYADKFERQTRGPGPMGRPAVTNLAIIVIQGVARADVDQTSARRLAWRIAKEVEQTWLGTTPDERLVGLLNPPIQRAEITACSVLVDTNSGDSAFAVAEMQFQVKVLSTEGHPDLS